MSEIKSDKFDKVFTNLLDSVLDLATQLAGKGSTELTKEESVFLLSFDDYLEALEELDED